MYVRNLSGTEYPLQATATWQSEIDGNRTMSLTVLPTKANNVFIADIAEMWVITDDDDVAHKVVYAKRQGVSDMLTVDIKAVPLFFDDFDNLRIYEEYNRHMTAMAAFTLIFAGTNYNFVLHDSHDAVDWEGFGAGESRLETFKRALNRYGAEFEISGNTIHLKALIGRDTQFQYRHRLNASNIVQEVDASGFWTYAKGYGDFGDGEGGGDWQDAKLIREYTSPLAQIPSIGLRHAPPIKDGRVKVVSAMDKSLKAHVDNSLKVSVTTDIHDLRKQGYALAQPQLGDRVYLTDEHIDFDEEVRVVAMSITKDWRGNVTHFSITIGDEGVTKRHMANMNTAIDNITNIVNGTQKIPYSVLDNAVLQATKALQNAQTELIFGTNGIVAIDKLDPNNVTILNSAGVGVSTNGGATFGEAITGRGINASYIVTGVLDAGQVLIRGGSATRYIHIDSSTLTSRGTFTRTWGGETDTADLQLGLYNGHIRVNNLNTGYNLYMTEKGLSTTLAGASPISAGTLEFHSQRFNTVSRGVTLHSTYGTAALVSDFSTVVLESDLTANIESKRFSVFVRPYRDSVVGNNEFRFWIKDNASPSDTDGVLAYGSNLNGQTSGLRFQKTTVGTPTVYATNGNGDLGSGNFDANHFLGALRAKATHAYVLAAYDGELRVTDKNGYNNGNYNLRPVLALSFHTPDGKIPQGFSSLRTMRVTENEATDAIRDLDLIRYSDGNNPGYKLPSGSVFDTGNGESSDILKAVMYTLKAIQEQSIEIDKLKGVS